MMVHHLGLDADQHDIGDGVAEGLEGEGLLDVLALAPPAGRAFQRGFDLGVGEDFVGHASRSLR